jgi:CheY-like chemotaxis protein
MKLMMTLGVETVYAKLEEILKPLAIETIIYRHIQKAMDNVEEIDPDVIIIDAGAFPRHWKSFVQFIREAGQQKHCPVILIKGKNFSSVEKNKAVFLGVDAVVSESFSEKGETANVLSIINSVIPEGERRLKIEGDKDDTGRFSLLITHPITGALLAGKVKTISEEGLVFYPDRPALAATIPFHAELYACSLRAGENILSPLMRLVKRDADLYLEFVSFPGSEQVIFHNYLSRVKK